MKRALSFLFLSLTTALCLAQEEPAAPAERKIVLAHYMAWYASKPVSGVWGWHWTMDRYNPDQRLENGWPEAASHDRPLMGLYDSGDPQVLECQVLQMKFAGIDGVIIDWYGIRNSYDYAMIHRNTQAILPLLERAGLKFAICYEDQAIGKMVAKGDLKVGEAVAHAREVFEWVETNWFSRDSYLRHQDRPVLITFGPQYFDPASWAKAIEGFASDPWMHALPHLAKDYGADGPFGWPPVHGGNTLTPSQWQANLEGLYARAKTGESVMGVAFPGYEDIYEQAGLHASYGAIAHREGQTFRETLDLAFQSDAALIQLATWNDYGEGTMIEPTENRGYRYLEDLQTRMKPGYDPEALRLPIRLLKLRRQAEEDDLAELDRISALLFTGKTELAAEALTKAEAH